MSGQGQIPTNKRLLLLLEEVVQAREPASPAVLNEKLQLPKATLHRLCATAEADGFLERALDGRSFGPGPRLRQLAVATLSSEPLRSVRATILRGLAREIGETCNIAIPGAGGMVYLDRVETHWPLRIQLPVGSEVPFHATASGKMYLSSLRRDYLDRLLKYHQLTKMTATTLTDRDALQTDLAQARAQGYATDAQEFMDGMVALAVPIFDDGQRPVATLSVHAPVQRYDLEGMVGFLAPLREAADDLGALLAQ